MKNKTRKRFNGLIIYKETGIKINKLLLACCSTYTNLFVSFGSP
jgi:hypothetical protein